MIFDLLLLITAVIFLIFLFVCFIAWGTTKNSSEAKGGCIVIILDLIALAVVIGLLAWRNW